MTTLPPGRSPAGPTLLSPRPISPWRALASCRDHDIALFFPSDGPHLISREQAAKQVCAGCPVRVRCLEHAVETSEPFGIWGGLTPGERGVVTPDL
ncbi:MAG: WhiB family transcriptional regulator [Frankia sp.]